MRPHFTSHHSAVELARYDLRKGSEVLGGTVIARSASKLRDHFEQFGACGFVHITLSAPEGVWLDRETWLASMRFVMKRHQFPVELTPWVMARHTDTPGDHVHCFAARETFEFREIRPIMSKAHTSETHQLLAERLGLPIPDYFSQAAPPRLHGSVPLRRLNRDTEYRRLADDLNAGLATWPENLGALNTALSTLASPYQIIEDVNVYGNPSLVCVSPTRRLRPSALGDAFFPVNLKKRIDWAGQLTRARLNLDMAVLLRTPEILRALDHAEHEKSDHRHSLRGNPPDAAEDRKNGAPDPGRDGKINRQVENDQGGRADLASPLRPVGGPGRLRPGRDGSGSSDQNDHGHENQAGSDRGRGDGRQRGGPDDQGKIRHHGRNTGSPGHSTQQRGGLTLLGWVARVLKIAGRVTPGFRHSLDIFARSMRLKFRDKSAVDVMPGSVTLREAGDSLSKDARLFTSAYASDFERHDVLENILDHNLPLTPGMTLCGTGPSKGHHSKKKPPPVQLMCLGLDLDPFSELVELFHGAIESELVAGPVCQIAERSTLQENHPRVLVIGSQAQERLQARDLKLTSILTDVITTCPDMTCVLPDRTITKASELSWIVPEGLPKSVQPHPENRPNDELIDDRCSAESDTPSDGPEPSF